jgi:hypothetical protein
LAVDPVGGALNYVIALLLAPIVLRPNWNLSEWNLSEWNLSEGIFQKIFSAKPESFRI